MASQHSERISLGNRHPCPEACQYLDPDLSIEPSTGEYLYERVAKLREHLMVDFPSVSAHIPAMNYKLPYEPGGSLNRDDLRQLRVDVLTVLQIVSNLTTITR